MTGTMMTEHKMHDKNVMMLDIESTNLKADYGYMLCASWKWEGKKKVHHAVITDTPTFKKDPTNDAWIVEQLRPELEKADLVVFHYGSRFDYPFLQTRALTHGLMLLPRIKWVDTWRVARDNLKLGSNRLANIAKVLGLEEKTALSPPIWIKAMAGDKKSIKYVVDHCDQDVRVLEQVYHKIKGLRYDNPSLRPDGDGCPTCGSDNVHRRGSVRTVKKEMYKWQCRDCGHWYQR